MASKIFDLLSKDPFIQDLREDMPFFPKGVALDEQKSQATRHSRTSFLRSLERMSLANLLSHTAMSMEFFSESHHG
jgi:hypothetical protein